MHHKNNMMPQQADDRGWRENTSCDQLRGIMTNAVIEWEVLWGYAVTDSGTFTAFSFYKVMSSNNTILIKLLFH